MNFITLGLRTYDNTTSQAMKILEKRIKPVPATKQLVEDLFSIQNTRIYLKVMESKMNIRSVTEKEWKWDYNLGRHKVDVQGKLSWENHAIFMLSEICEGLRFYNLFWIRHWKYIWNYHCHQGAAPSGPEGIQTANGL